MSKDSPAKMQQMQSYKVVVRRYRDLLLDLWWLTTGPRDEALVTTDASAFSDPGSSKPKAAAKKKPPAASSNKLPAPQVPRLLFPETDKVICKLYQQWNPQTRAERNLFKMLKIMVRKHFLNKREFISYKSQCFVLSLLTGSSSFSGIASEKQRKKRYALKQDEMLRPGTPSLLDEWERKWRFWQQYCLSSAKYEDAAGTRSGRSPNKAVVKPQPGKTVPQPEWRRTWNEGYGGAGGGKKAGAGGASANNKKKGGASSSTSGGAGGGGASSLEDASFMDILSQRVQLPPDFVVPTDDATVPGLPPHLSPQKASRATKNRLAESQTLVQLGNYDAAALEDADHQHHATTAAVNKKPLRALDGSVVPSYLTYTREKRNKIIFGPPENVPKGFLCTLEEAADCLKRAFESWGVSLEEAGAGGGGPEDSTLFPNGSDEQEEIDEFRYGTMPMFDEQEAGGIARAGGRDFARPRGMSRSRTMGGGASTTSRGQSMNRSNSLSRANTSGGLGGDITEECGPVVPGENNGNANSSWLKSRSTTQMNLDEGAEQTEQQNSANHVLLGTQFSCSSGEEFGNDVPGMMGVSNHVASAHKLAVMHHAMVVANSDRNTGSRASFASSAETTSSVGGGGSSSAATGGGGQVSSHSHSRHGSMTGAAVLFQPSHPLGPSAGFKKGCKPSLFWDVYLHYAYPEAFGVLPGTSSSPQNNSEREAALSLGMEVHQARLNLMFGGGPKLVSYPFKDSVQQLKEQLELNQVDHEVDVCLKYNQGVGSYEEWEYLSLMNEMNAEAGASGSIVPLRDHYLEPAYAKHLKEKRKAFLAVAAGDSGGAAAAGGHRKKKSEKTSATSAVGFGSSAVARPASLAILERQLENGVLSPEFHGKQVSMARKHEHEVALRKVSAMKLRKFDKDSMREERPDILSLGDAAVVALEESKTPKASEGNGNLERKGSSVRRSSTSGIGIGLRRRGSSATGAGSGEQVGGAMESKVVAVGAFSKQMSKSEVLLDPKSATQQSFQSSSSSANTGAGQQSLTSGSSANASTNPSPHVTVGAEGFSSSSPPPAPVQPQLSLSPQQQRQKARASAKRRARLNKAKTFLWKQELVNVQKMREEFAGRTQQKAVEAEFQALHQERVLAAGLHLQGPHQGAVDKDFPLYAGMQHAVRFNFEKAQSVSPLKGVLGPVVAGFDASEYLAGMASTTAENTAENSRTSSKDHVGGGDNKAAIRSQMLQAVDAVAGDVLDESVAATDHLKVNYAAARRTSAFKNSSMPSSSSPARGRRTLRIETEEEDQMNALILGGSSAENNSPSNAARKYKHVPDSLEFRSLVDETFSVKLPPVQVHNELYESVFSRQEKALPLVLEYPRLKDRGPAFPNGSTRWHASSHAARPQPELVLSCSGGNASGSPPQPMNTRLSRRMSGSSSRADLMGPAGGSCTSPTTNANAERGGDMNFRDTGTSFMSTANSSEQYPRGTGGGGHHNQFGFQSMGTGFFDTANNELHSPRTSRGATTSMSMSNAFQHTELLPLPSPPLSAFEQKKNAALDQYKLHFQGSKGNCGVVAKTSSTSSTSPLTTRTTTAAAPAAVPASSTVKRYTLESWGRLDETEHERLQRIKTKDGRQKDSDFAEKVRWGEYFPDAPEEEAEELKSPPLSPLAQETLKELALEKKRRRGELFEEEQNAGVKTEADVCRERADFVKGSVGRLEKIFAGKDAARWNNYKTPAELQGEVSRRRFSVGRTGGEADVETRRGELLTALSRTNLESKVITNAKAASLSPLKKKQFLYPAKLGGSLSVSPKKKPKPKNAASLLLSSVRTPSPRSPVAAQEERHPVGMSMSVASSSPAFAATKSPKTTSGAAVEKKHAGSASKSEQRELSMRQVEEEFAREQLAASRQLKKDLNKDFNAGGSTTMKTDSDITMKIESVPYMLRAPAGKRPKRMDTAESSVAKYFDFQVGSSYHPTFTVQGLHEQLERFPIPSPGDNKLSESRDQDGNTSEAAGSRTTSSTVVEALLPKLEMRESLYAGVREFPAFPVRDNLPPKKYQRAHFDYFSRCGKANDVPVAVKSIFFLEAERKFQEKQAALETLQIIKLDSFFLNWKGRGEYLELNKIASELAVKSKRELIGEGSNLLGAAGGGAVDGAAIAKSKAEGSLKLTDEVGGLTDLLGGQTLKKMEQHDLPVPNETQSTQFGLGDSCGNASHANSTAKKMDKSLMAQASAKRQEAEKLQRQHDAENVHRLLDVSNLGLTDAKLLQLLDFYAGALAVRNDAKNKAPGDHHSSNKASVPAAGGKGGTTTSTSQPQLANKLVSVRLNGNHHLTDESLVPLFHRVIGPYGDFLRDFDLAGVRRMSQFSLDALLHLCSTKIRNLHRLNLNGVNLSGGYFAPLCEALANNCAFLSILSLSDCKIGAGDRREAVDENFLEMVAQRLKSLDLSQNALDEAFFYQKLGTAMNESLKLQFLDLSYNTTVGGPPRTTGAASSSVQLLEDPIKSTVQPLAYLFVALRTQKTLRSLVLQSCGLDAGLDLLLSDLLGEPTCAIRSLDLKQNSHGYLGLQYLLRGVLQQCYHVAAPQMGKKRPNPGGPTDLDLLLAETHNAVVNIDVGGSRLFDLPVKLGEELRGSAVGGAKGAGEKDGGTKGRNKAADGSIKADPDGRQPFHAESAALWDFSNPRLGKYRLYLGNPVHVAVLGHVRRHLDELQMGLSGFLTVEGLRIDDTEVDAGKYGAPNSSFGAFVSGPGLLQNPKLCGSAVVEFELRMQWENAFGRKPPLQEHFLAPAAVGELQGGAPPDGGALLANSVAASSSAFISADASNPQGSALLPPHRLLFRYGHATRFEMPLSGVVGLLQFLQEEHLVFHSPLLSLLSKMLHLKPTQFRMLGRYLEATKKRRALYPLACVTTLYSQERFADFSAQMVASLRRPERFLMAGVAKAVSFNARNPAGRYVLDLGDFNDCCRMDYLQKLNLFDRMVLEEFYRRRFWPASILPDSARGGGGAAGAKKAAGGGAAAAKKGAAKGGGGVELSADAFEKFGEWVTEFGAVRSSIRNVTVKGASRAAAAQRRSSGGGVGVNGSSSSTSVPLEPKEWGRGQYWSNVVATASANVRHFDPRVPSLNVWDYHSLDPTSTSATLSPYAFDYVGVNWLGLQPAAGAGAAGALLEMNDDTTAPPSGDFVPKLLEIFSYERNEIFSVEDLVHALQSVSHCLVLSSEDVARVLEYLADRLEIERAVERAKLEEEKTRRRGIAEERRKHAVIDVEHVKSVVDGLADIRESVKKARTKSRISFEEDEDDHSASADAFHLKKSGTIEDVATVNGVAEHEILAGVINAEDSPLVNSPTSFARRAAFQKSKTLEEVLSPVGTGNKSMSRVFPDLEGATSTRSPTAGAGGAAAARGGLLRRNSSIDSMGGGSSLRRSRSLSSNGSVGDFGVLAVSSPSGKGARGGGGAGAAAGGPHGAGHNFEHKGGSSKILDAGNLDRPGDLAIEHAIELREERESRRKGSKTATGAHVDLQQKKRMKGRSGSAGSLVVIGGRKLTRKQLANKPTTHSIFKWRSTNTAELQAGVGGNSTNTHTAGGGAVAVAAGAAEVHLAAEDGATSAASAQEQQQPITLDHPVLQQVLLVLAPRCRDSEPGKLMATVAGAFVGRNKSSAGATSTARSSDASPDALLPYTRPPIPRNEERVGVTVAMVTERQQVLGFLWKAEDFLPKKMLELSASSATTSTSPTTLASLQQLFGTHLPFFDPAALFVYDGKKNPRTNLLQGAAAAEPSLRTELQKRLAAERVSFDKAAAAGLPASEDGLAFVLDLQRPGDRMLLKMIHACVVAVATRSSSCTPESMNKEKLSFTPFFQNILYLPLLHAVLHTENGAVVTLCENYTSSSSSYAVTRAARKYHTKDEIDFEFEEEDFLKIPCELYESKARVGRLVLDGSEAFLQKVLGVEVRGSAAVGFGDPLSMGGPGTSPEGGAAAGSASPGAATTAGGRMGPLGESYRGGSTFATLAAGMRDGSELSGLLYFEIAGKGMPESADEVRKLADRFTSLCAW